MEEILIVLRITFFAKMCLKIDAKIQLIEDFTFARLIQIFSQLKIANNILSAMIPFLGKLFYFFCQIIAIIAYISYKTKKFFWLFLFLFVNWASQKFFLGVLPIVVIANLPPCNNNNTIICNIILIYYYLIFRSSFYAKLATQCAEKIPEYREEYEEIGKIRSKCLKFSFNSSQK